jgi:hypothetical protein
VPDARHLDLDRDRNVAFNLLGRLAWVLGDDLDAWRHRVRIGLDVELGEADDAGDEHEQQQRDHQNALLQREGDDRVHVYCPARPFSRPWPRGR